MILLASISWMGLGLLLLFGFAMFKCTRGSCGHESGFLAKSIGIVAVLAGVWMLVRIATFDHDAGRPAAIERLEFDKGVLLGRGFNSLEDDFDPLAGHEPRVVRYSAPRLGMFILLGAGLIILGAMLFGRDRQRPFALRAITWLGIGAILFAVANFFVEGPRADRVSRRVVDAHDRRAEAERASRKSPRPGRAKRPALRPERPLLGSSTGDSSRGETASLLPPRAGSIPVEIEIAKAAAKTKAAADDEQQESVAQATTAAVGAEQAPEPVREQKPTIEDDDSRPVAKALLPDGHRNRSDRGPALIGGVYRITVSSGPWSTVPECQRALDDEVLAATNNYINEYLGDPQAAEMVNVSPAYLRQRVYKAEHAEVIDSPAVGAMHQLHADLEFDARTRADFKQMWRNAVVESRLWYVGGGGVLVLALLATLYGYLKFEMRTDAAHRGKLQLAATLVALIVAAGALLARWTVVF